MTVVGWSFQIDFAVTFGAIAPTRPRSRRCSAAVANVVWIRCARSSVLTSRRPGTSFSAPTFSTVMTTLASTGSRATSRATARTNASTLRRSTAISTGWSWRTLPPRSDRQARAGQLPVRPCS